MYLTLLAARLTRPMVTPWHSVSQTSPGVCHGKPVDSQERRVLVSTVLGALGWR